MSMATNYHHMDTDEYYRWLAVIEAQEAAGGFDHDEWTDEDEEEYQRAIGRW